MIVYLVSGLFLTISWVAHFQNHLSCWQTRQKEQICFLGSRPTTQFFFLTFALQIISLFPFLAVSFLVVQLPQLLLASTSEISLAPRWCLPLPPTLECECRSLFPPGPLLPLDTDTKSHHLLVAPELSAETENCYFQCSAGLLYLFSAQHRNMCLYLPLTYP